jgi:hypothetical protein
MKGLFKNHMVMEEDLLGKLVNQDKFEYYEPKPDKPTINILGQSFDLQHMIQKQS